MAKVNVNLLAKDVMEHQNVRYSSGCFVYNNIKYSPTDFVKKQLKDNYEYFETIKTPKDISAFIEALRFWSDENKTIWPLSSIAQKALDSDKKISRDSIKLTDAQLALIAQILYHPYSLQKFIVISGRAGTGKSTFMNIIGQLLDNDISTIENTRGSNYDLDQILSSRLAYADDMVGKLPIEEGRLKTLVTHGQCSIDPKFQQKYTFKNPQTIICFLANKDPYIDISDPGILRRVVWYSMDDKIKNPDPMFGTESYEHAWLTEVAILSRDYDRPDWFECYFRQDTIKHLIRCNSVWKYLDCTDDPFYGGYTDFMVKSGNKNIYSAESYEALYDAYYDYTGRKEPDICEADLELN